MSPSDVEINGQMIIQAIGRVSTAFHMRHEYLTELDQALGDGDLGITIDKVADALQEYIQTDPGDDLGKWLARAGI